MFKFMRMKRSSIGGINISTMCDVNLSVDLLFRWHGVRTFRFNDEREPRRVDVKTIRKFTEKFLNLPSGLLAWWVWSPLNVSDDDGRGRGESKKKPVPGCLRSSSIVGTQEGKQWGHSPILNYFKLFHPRSTRLGFVWTSHGNRFRFRERLLDSDDVLWWMIACPWKIRRNSKQTSFLERELFSGRGSTGKELTRA